jgi:CMP-N,N'-diacetyllegionaminic acid synthase
MNNIAIITARSGSKGLKNKNILPLAGKPLMAYSIEAAVQSGIFSTVMVSTDSQEYADIARKYGAEVPFLRSAETSSDNAGSWDAVKEVLSGYEKKLGRRFDTVCLLQPTSPLRIADDIIGGYREFEDKAADAVTAVCEVDHSPEWCMTLDDSLSLQDFRKHTATVPRQKMDKYFRLNGALFIRKIKYSDSGIQILDQNEFAYIMDKRRSVDIDTIEDFEYAEFLMKKYVEKEKSS